MADSMRLLLVHYKDEDLGSTFHEYFDNKENVQIIDGDICKIKCDAIVSPANSFGFMDGGIDAYYTFRFGADLQERLQAEIKLRPLKELLVGEALIVSTRDSDIPWLISAPTMRVPANIADTINPYLAMKAIILSAMTHKRNPQIETIAIPGLGTGTGKMNKRVCAKQMLMAYEEILLGKFHYPKKLGESIKNQEEMKK